MAQPWIPSNLDEDHVRRGNPMLSLLRLGELHNWNGLIRLRLLLLEKSMTSQHCSSSDA